MSELTVFLQQLFAGLSVGALYALLALGYSLILGVCKIINLAQGDTYMLGAYIGMSIALCVPGLSPLLALPLVLIGSMLGAAAFGSALERLVVRPTRLTRPGNLLVATVGVSIVLRNAAMLIWGSDARPFPKILSLPPIPLGGMYIPADYLIVVLVTLLCVSVFSMVLYRTKVGKALRAVSQDRDAAALVGVNLSMTDSTVFAVSSALGAIGGVLIGPLVFLTPYMGALGGLKGFTAAVLGGLGYLPGAVVGGFTLGILENLTAAYISSQYRHAIAFLVLVVFLVVKPKGIFGKSVVVKL